MNSTTPTNPDFFDRLPYDEDYPDLYSDDVGEGFSEEIGRQYFGSLFELRRHFGDPDDLDIY